jgi:hypothetical protein
MALCRCWTGSFVRSLARASGSSRPSAPPASQVRTTRSRTCDRDRRAAWIGVSLSCNLSAFFSLFDASRSFTRNTSVPTPRPSALLPTQSTMHKFSGGSGLFAQGMQDDVDERMRVACDELVEKHRLQYVRRWRLCAFCLRQSRSGRASRCLGGKSVLSAPPLRCFFCQ